MLDNVASIEIAEGQLARFIEKRGRGLSGRDHANADAARERAHTARRRARIHEENRWAWVRHFEGLAESHARLSEENAAKAAALLMEGAGP